MKKLILALTIIALLFGAVSCNGDVDERMFGKKATVTYISNGGSSVPSETINVGTCISEPEDPTYESYVFQGWFKQGAFEVFDFSTPVSEDLTLYAHWEGLVETKTKTETIDLNVGGKIEVDVSPIAEDETKKTTIDIPANAFAGVEGSSSSKLAVTSYSIEVAPITFTILDQSAENNLAVAGLDCILTINDEVVTEFEEEIIVSTYIPKGLSSVEVVYNGNDGKSQPDAGGTDLNKKNVAKIYENNIGDNLGYDKETGFLRFSTEHFSEFYVATNAEVCIVDDSNPSDISAMTLGEFRDSVNDGNDYEGFTVTVLKDCDYTNEDWEPIGYKVYRGVSNSFAGIFNGNHRTIKVKNDEITCCDYFGFFGEVYNTDDEYPRKRIYDLNLEVDFVCSHTEMPYNVVGGLASEFFGWVDIDNVKVSGRILSNRIAGGLVGTVLNYSDVLSYNITNCSVEADVGAFSVFTSDNWLAVGGLIGQNDCKGDGTVVSNCSFTGNLTTDFTGKTTSASSYMGYVMAKGANDGGNEVTTITNFTVGEGSSIVGYQNCTTHGYPFEGRNMAIEEGQTGDYTYTGIPNHNKELLGGYFYKCIIDGVETSGKYPHGTAQE